MGDATPPDASYAQTVSDLGVTLTIGALRKVFSEWRIWEAGGTIFASCPGMVTAIGPQSLIHPVVVATTLLGLAAQLEMQELLRRMTPDELEAVWREGFTAYAPETDGAPEAGH